MAWRARVEVKGLDRIHVRAILRALPHRHDAGCTLDDDVHLPRTNSALIDR